MCELWLHGAHFPYLLPPTERSEGGSNLRRGFAQRASELAFAGWGRLDKFVQIERFCKPVPHVVLCQRHQLKGVVMSVSHASDFRTRVAEALTAGVITGDGHTLFSPDYYAPYFTAEELNEAGLIETHESDGTHKGSIFAADGSLIERLEAVYNLEFLYWVARAIGAKSYTQSSGRGSQARELIGFIRAELALSK